MLGATPEVGCASVTQFVGLIPPGRAPDHFHRYDEVIYILEGEGAWRSTASRRRFAPGSCVHLPRAARPLPREHRRREMRVLGVFRPAGSPAEAYYPDGTPAAVLPERRTSVPRIERTAEVAWDGNVARGNGAITAATGAFSELPFSLPTRIGDAEGKTSPEELLAAAHAGCFTMSLASELTSDGTPPGRLDVHCTIVMDEVPDEGHQIVGSNVAVRAEADGVSDEALAELMQRAHEGCPFSTLLGKAGVVVDVQRGCGTMRM